MRRDFLIKLVGAAHFALLLGGSAAVIAGLLGVGTPIPLVIGGLASILISLWFKALHLYLEGRQNRDPYEKIIGLSLKTAVALQAVQDAITEKEG